MNKIIISSFAALFLISCSSVNNYELKTPNNLDTQTKFEIKNWRALGKDDNLNRLIEIAMQNNEDVKMALNNLLIAESNLVSAGIKREPSVNLSLNANERIANNSKPIYGHTLGLNLSYEIDLLNKLGKAKENALFSANISEIDVESTYQTIGFSIANLYYKIVATNKKIEILEDFVKSYEKTLKLKEEQYKLGFITKSVLLQTKEQASLNQTKLRSLKLERDLYESSLNILVYGLNQQKEEIKYANDLLDDFVMPKSVPSSVMTNRPDIAKAILNVKIAHNNAKIAWDNFFPTFTIGAGISTSGDTHKVFSDPIGTISANLLQPLFNLGETDEQVIRANLSQDNAVLTYEKVVKTALKEIEDAILQYNNAELKLKDYDAIIKLEEEIYEFNKLKFSEGEISFLEFLDSERALQNSLIEQIDLRLGKITAGIDAYKAIGVRELEFRK